MSKLFDNILIHIVTRSSSESTSVIGAYAEYDDAVQAMEDAEETYGDRSMPTEFEIHSTRLR